jgi:hypothetical protein
MEAAETQELGRELTRSYAGGVMLQVGRSMPNEHLGLSVEAGLPEWLLRIR